MNLLTKWNKKKITVSAPDHFDHKAHVSHDDITQKLQGLPPEWVAILRENGVVGEDLVLVKNSKRSGLYSTGSFGLSNSSLLSNRSLQKLWRSMSGKRENGGIEENSEVVEAMRSSTIEENTMAGQSAPKLPQMDASASPLDLTPSDVQSSVPSRQATFDNSATANDIDQLGKDCGLTFRHKDFDEIKHSLFAVVDSLGHGSLGVVEEVRVSPQHQTLVRKRVQIPYHKRKQYLKIINQEAQVLQSLSHCHIVKIIGSYGEMPDTGRQFYSLLMAPVGQRDLKTFLDMVGDQWTTQKPDWIADRRTWLRNWFKCLSSALAYIHSMGVRHQDIKPSNIIHRGSTIYFTDFSSASQFEIGQTTSTENPARTSAMYAAPEVIDSYDSLNRHGRGTDVFALGAVFTEMLAVLRGHSIDEYYHFLVDKTAAQEQNQRTPTPAPRQSFLYGRKVAAVETFFKDDEFYKTCVSNMLLADREQRPDAKEVATQIRGFEPWILRGCTCDLEENG